MSVMRCVVVVAQGGSLLELMLYEHDVMCRRCHAGLVAAGRAWCGVSSLSVCQGWSRLDERDAVCRRCHTGRVAAG